MCVYVFVIGYEGENSDLEGATDMSVELSKRVFISVSHVSIPISAYDLTVGSECSNGESYTMSCMQTEQ